MAALVAAAGMVPLTVPAAHAAVGTTAWQSGRFQTDPAGLVRRSDIVLGAANTSPSQAMPLGNGTLGAAVWAAGGFTAQLNRSDTLPDRKSPGWLTIPGLSKLTSAPDFTGYVDLYDATIHESGGGMTATVYTRADKDELVVDVTGADPNTPQTASLNLWSPRAPEVLASGAIGTLAETWVDNTQPGATGQTFGSLAAITAGGSQVSVAAVDSETVRATVTPNADGTFRVIAAAPHWTGGDAQATAAALLGGDASASASSLTAGHLAWWHAFWGRVGLIKFSSADGSADYLENLRTLDLYDAAAESRDTFPGSQAGVADLFSTGQDWHTWDAAAYWQWNLRMQVQANTSSGAFDLNAPYFRLYQQNLASIQAATQANMGGRAGLCVPETMRFNGTGLEYTTAGVTHPDCNAASASDWNARTISTGAEVGLWVWQQYLTTGDRSFLAANYPLMSGAAQFLLAYATTGSDGYLHTYPSNAHETQWDVHDPTTDIAAEQALFPATVAAAQVLGTDTALVSTLTAAEAKIEPFARTDAATQSQLLTPASDAAGQDVIAPSYDPSATKHNSENIGLEPVWPYGLIGDNSALTDLAKRTFANRPNKQANDWSDDPLDAARLGLSSDMASTLIGLTESFQKLPSGLATFVNNDTYAEQQGVVAAALNESLVQDYDGLLRIAPALPAGWDADGTVFIQGGSTVSVQVHGAVIGTVGINAGSTGTIAIRNPWPGQSVQVVNGGDESTVIVAPTSASQFSIPVSQGSSYLVEPVSALTSSLPFAQVTGTQATAAKHLGSVQIGLDAAPSYTSLAASFNNVGITGDTNTAPGNFDGGGASMSATALANAGAGAGSTISSSGLSFTMPNVAAGTPDNTVAAGQKIAVGGGGALGFLVSASYGPSSGTGTVTYTDGTTSSYTLNAPDWSATTPPTGGAVAVSSTYQNRQGNTTYSHTADLFSETVPVTAGKTIASVTLPPGGPLTAGTPALHIFAIATANPPVISLRAHANNMIVTADNAGASALIANRTAISTWEEFDLVNNTDGSVSLRAHANNMYVTADNAGASPLIANRTAISTWEEFDLINNTDGSVSLRAHANNMIVTAENAGSSPLIANRTAINAWEEFDLIHD